MMYRLLLLGSLALTGAQLRPKRVGVSPMGEEMAGGEDVGAADGAANGGMAELLKAMGGAGGMDMDALKNLGESLNDNPMFAQAMQGMQGMQGNGEMADEMANLMANPEALAEKMGEIGKLMGSGEGQEATAKIMEEVQSVLSDPDKMRQGLEQFANNPMLKGVADAVPELQEVLNNPALMEESIAQAQKMFAGGLDGDKMQELMGNMFNQDALKEVLNNPELLQEGMKKAQALFGGAGGADLSQMMGQMGGAEGLQKLMAGGGLEGLMGGAGGAGGDSDLKERVRAQMAGMMREAGGEEEEF